MFYDKQPSVPRSVSETKIQNDELLGIWERISTGKEMNLIRISTMEECDMRI